MGSPLSTDYLVRLRREISKLFSLEELKILCYDLQIPFDELEGDTIALKTVSLIDYSKKHNRLLELIEYCKKERPPAIQWELTYKEQETSKDNNNAQSREEKLSEKRGSCAVPIIVALIGAIGLVLASVAPRLITPLPALPVETTSPTIPPTTPPTIPPTTPPTIPPKEIVLFQDNFDSEESRNNWVEAKDAGPWEISNGHYKCPVNPPYVPESLIKNADWSDYTVSLRFQQLPASINPQVPNLGLMIRVQDFKNHYSVALRDGLARIGLLLDGVWQKDLSQAEFEVREGEWYDLTVNLSGDLIKVYIDNKLIVQAKDKRLQKGAFGLRCAENSEAYFANILVTSTETNNQ